MTKSVPDVKITLFFQSVTGAWSKLHFSSIFVRYSSRMFDDFRGFQRFCMFLHVLLNASRRQLASKGVHSRGFHIDPINFELKIHEISALGGNRYLNVVRSAPDMKIALFCKVLPGRVPNTIFHRFL